MQCGQKYSAGRGSLEILLHFHQQFLSLKIHSSVEYGLKDILKRHGRGVKQITFMSTLIARIYSDI